MRRERASPLRQDQCPDGNLRGDTFREAKCKARAREYIGDMLSASNVAVCLTESCPEVAACRAHYCVACRSYISDIFTSRSLSCARQACNAARATVGILVDKGSIPLSSAASSFFSAIAALFSPRSTLSLVYSFGLAPCAWRKILNYT